MDFRFSEIIDPNTYELDGLCDGIDLRMHKDPLGEKTGAIRCQKDWSRLISTVNNFNGGLGDPFSFMRVTVPECLPERLEIISYANEYAFLYDDAVMEDLDQNLESEYRDILLDEFSKNDSLNTHYNNSDKRADTMRNGIKQIQSQILQEMMVIDRERASTTMKSWQRFIQVVSSRQRSEPFSGLEEYLPYKISDAGELFWFGLMTFGMGLTIPEVEMNLCKQLGHSAWAALALTNDLYSWEKERDAAKRAGVPHVINAVCVLMREYSIPETEARDLCRQKIREYVAEAIRAVERTKANVGLSLDLRKYIEAILYSISGNLEWSIYCPRYHPQNSYDDTIRSMKAEVVQGPTEIASIAQ